MSQELLVTILDDVASKLDHVLKHGPINEHIRQKTLPAELLRRSGVCLYAPELLQSYLKMHDIRTSQYLKKMGNSGNSDLVHIVLKMDENDKYIDPTWQQFYYYTGLMPHAAQHDNRQAQLYPDNDIAIISDNDSAFIDQVTATAQHIDEELERIIPGHSSFTYAHLANTTSDQKRKTYEDVWDMSTYQPNSHSHKLSVRRALAESANMLIKL